MAAIGKPGYRSLRNALRAGACQDAPWAGQHRNLAAGGFVDPSLAERTGLPLAEPLGAWELLEMRGWGYRNRWVPCGLVASPDGPRAVAVIAHREDPAAAGFRKKPRCLPNRSRARSGESSGFLIVHVLDAEELALHAQPGGGLS
jgi:hypothetical protein